MGRSPGDTRTLFITRESRLTMTTRRSTFFLIGAIAWTSAVFAQQPTAEITGIITDATGAAVPGALIEAVNSDTGLRRETTSNESGNYVFSVLPLGPYRVDVKKTGFE